MRISDILWILSIIVLSIVLMISMINKASAKQYNVGSYFKTIYVADRECLQNYRYYSGQEIPIGAPICFGK